MSRRFEFLDHPGPIPFAHRGGALEAPENTWASFSHARELGYRYMETDVHATRDGVVVTIHDPDLQRVATRPGRVREMSWRELSQVRLTEGEPVPRLDELLSAWPEVRWNIDAKHDSVVGPLVQAIQRASAVSRICVSSFSDRRIAALTRALGPTACTTMGPAAVTMLRAASVLGERAGPLSAGLRRFGAAQVPVREGPVRVVDRRFVDAAHRIGAEVHVWTVDHAETMNALLDLGVDGLMTDRPTVLKEVLQLRGEWS